MNDLAKKLLAEEVPNNKVPDGTWFPEWDKAGTPPSQIEENLGGAPHVEPIVITISDPSTDTEMVIDIQLDDSAERRRIISTLARMLEDAVTIPGVVGVNVGY